MIFHLPQFVVTLITFQWVFFFKKIIKYEMKQRIKLFKSIGSDQAMKNLIGFFIILYSAELAQYILSLNHNYRNIWNWFFICCNLWLTITSAMMLPQMTSDILGLNWRSKQKRKKNYIYREKVQTSIAIPTLLVKARRKFYSLL